MKADMDALIEHLEESIDVVAQERGNPFDKTRTEYLHGYAAGYQQALHRFLGNLKDIRRNYENQPI